MSTYLEVNSGVVIGVDGLAEVDGIAEFFLQDRFAGVARQFEEEETGVRLWQVVVGRLVLIQNLRGTEI